MAIPDETFFAIEGITFGHLRNSNSTDERIQLLKKRLDSFFIGQIDALGMSSPFVKAIMSCIAIETLGSIFFFKNQ
jgi:hypothetical protein